MKSYIYLKAIIIIISNLLNGQINTEEMRFESLNDGIHNSVGMNLGVEQANVQQFDASFLDQEHPKFFFDPLAYQFYFLFVVS